MRWDDPAPPTLSALDTALIAVISIGLTVGLGYTFLAVKDLVTAPAAKAAPPPPPRHYEVACEGPDGWERFTVDFNVYGKPRSFRQGVMRFETTEGIEVHGSNCIAKHPAEWCR